MIVTIELENMDFRAKHGCYDLEKVVGNHFSVNVALEAEVGDAAERDELSKTINYLTVYELCRTEMAQPSNTLENVAYRIAEALYNSFNQIIRATVKVSKLAPPLGGKVEKVSVTVTK